MGSPFVLITLTLRRKGQGVFETRTDKKVDVKMKAGIGEMKPQTKAHQWPQESKRDEEDFFPRASEERMVPLKT